MDQRGSSTSSFAATRWTLVLRAQGRTPEAELALSELCAAYYQPVFRFLQKEMRHEDNARELAQEFFARILKRREVGTADPSRGRFRSYLLGAVKHFLADHRDYLSRLRRGGGVISESLDDPESACTREARIAESAVPDTWFDRQWAFTVIDRSLSALREEMIGSGKGEQFDALKTWLVADAAPVSQAALGKTLGLSEAATKVAIHRLRKRFRERVRAEIAQTVADGEDIDAELKYLIEVMAHV